MTDDILDGMTDAEAQAWGRWHAMMRMAHELGMIAQNELLSGQQIKPSQRMFFTRKERRELLRLTSVS